MGRRSRSRTIWPARQEAPAPRGVRLKVCADCRAPDTQLVRGPNRLLRCPVCIAQGIRQAAQALKSGLEAARHAPPAVRTVERLVTRATQEKPHKAGQVGRCRRHAPTMSGYPVVLVTDWCGDHKLDETHAP